jgi:hypothetical protein
MKQQQRSFVHLDSQHNSGDALFLADDRASHTTANSLNQSEK